MSSSPRHRSEPVVRSERVLAAGRTIPSARALVSLARHRGRSLARSGSFPWAAPTWPGTVPRPAPRLRTGEDYPTEWARRYPARLFRAVLTDNITRPAMHLLATPLVRGSELLSLVDAPVIFVANHVSHLDTPVLVSVIPSHFRHHTAVAAAADHFFDRRWKSHLWALAFGAIPIERHRVSRRSANTAAALIDDGWNLVIFPEGGRSPDGWQQPFRGGAAYLAVRTGRPVVPVHLAGTHQILPKNGRRLRRGTTTVTFGSPLHVEDGEDARRFGARVETAVATLAAETRTDWWTARRDAARTTASGRAGIPDGLVAAAQGPDASPWRRAWDLGPSDGGDDDPGRWAVHRD